MAKVVKFEEEPLKEMPCPRGCGNLRYGRTLEYGMRKRTDCKKCKGIMISLDELKTFENKGIKSFNKLRKNKLWETLSSGSLGSLACPKCSKTMVEIELFYKRGRHMAKQEEAMLNPSKNLGFFARGIPIIGEFFGAVMLTVDLAADLKHGKLNKSVTIDSCPSCFIFWFDKREIALLSMNDVTTKSKNSNVKVAPPNSQPTPGVVTASKSEIEGDVEE